MLFLCCYSSSLCFFYRSALFTSLSLALIYGHHCYSSSQQTSKERLCVLLSSPFCSSKDNTFLFGAQHGTESSFVVIHELFAESLILTVRFTRIGFVMMTLISYFRYLTLNMEVS